MSPSSIALAPQKHRPFRPTAERRQLEERLAAEHTRLLARHKQEAEQLVTQGRPLDDLRQQHERERRLFQLYAERERQALDNRLRRARRRMRLRLQSDEQDPWRPVYE